MKTLKSDAIEIIEKNTEAMWNKCGMPIDTITNPIIAFVVRVIMHRFYQSSQLNIVPCIAINLGHNIVKRDHNYDLAKLQIQQLSENLEAKLGNQRVPHVSLDHLSFALYLM